MIETRTGKTSIFLKIFQILLACALTAGLAFSPQMVSRAKTIPTFNIVSVVKDVSVTIQTSTFPPDKLFTVRIGYGNTDGSGGVVVATTNSGTGGAFQETYLIPDLMKGQAVLTIRMDAPGGYYAYNYFNNDPNFLSPATPATAGTVSSTIPGYHGVPTFSIGSVEGDSKVTIKMHNFPPEQDFTVRMGFFGTVAKGGEIVATTNSGAGGELEETYEIPASMKGVQQIAIRMDAPTGHFAYNWFYNNTTVSGTGGTGGTGGTTGTGGESMAETGQTPVVPDEPSYTGTPSFTIGEVQQDTAVTILTSNLPPQTDYTVLMGPYGSLGVGGTVAASGKVEDNGNQTLTFNIPANLKGHTFIALRMEASNGYYAYNWFRNLSTLKPVVPADLPTGPTPTPVAAIPSSTESTTPSSSQPAPEVVPNVSADYNSVPSFTISSVVKDSMVSVFAKDFPPGQTFTIRMGEYGTAAVGGVVVSTTETGKGGDFTATYTIPDSLKGTEAIAIRMDSTAGYFAYNWFYNSSSR
jgi:hypothetical protein